MVAASWDAALNAPLSFRPLAILVGTLGAMAAIDYFVEPRNDALDLFIEVFIFTGTLVLEFLIVLEFVPFIVRSRWRIRAGGALR